MSLTMVVWFKLSADITIAAHTKDLINLHIHVFLSTMQCDWWLLIFFSRNIFAEILIFLLNTGLNANSSTHTFLHSHTHTAPKNMHVENRNSTHTHWTSHKIKHTKHWDASARGHIYKLTPPHTHSHPQDRCTIPVLCACKTFNTAKTQKATKRTTVS